MEDAMPLSPRRLAVASLLAVPLALQVAPGRADNGKPPLALAPGETWTLPRGTHRPELLVAPDGTLLLVVVHPDGRRGEGKGSAKHRAYRYDPRTRKPIGEPFVVTRTTDEFGEPADHRAAFVGDELFVAYQSNVMRPGGHRGGGPAEDRAESQSLLLARFSPDGTERLRVPLVARATDFRQENFPDFCLVALADRLLVCTGTRSRTAKIREVLLDGTVTATHEVETSPDAVSSNIGNSLFVRDGRVHLLSSDRMRDLTLAEFSPSFVAKGVARWSTEEREQHFPVGNLPLGDLLLVTYISHAPDSSPDPMQNPYRPRLKAVDQAHREVLDLEVGGDGFAHVHPMPAAIGDRLYVAWSSRSEGGRVAAPQVVVQ
jgi:hypothetical protein